MVWVGTSGFSFKGWVGPVYPPGTRPHQMFPYYVHCLGFKCLELNYTFYRQPQTRTMEALSRISGEDFRFTVKAHSSLTHNTAGTTGDEQRSSSRRFLDGIKPLTEAGKLGCVLAQFPRSFYPSDSSLSYLQSLAHHFSGLELVVEFRNKCWAREEHFEFLHRLGLGVCAVDEPRERDLMPFVPHFTSKIAYFRLHGRNERWFSHPESRYDYLYSRDELRSLSTDFTQAHQDGLETYVFFNNCHAGAAARNAAMIRELLGQVESPQPRLISLEAIS